MSERTPVVFDTLDQMPEILVSRATMLWNKTGTWRYMRPRHRRLTPPCHTGCPAGNNIEGFIKLALDGHTQGALAEIKKENPFPAVCGRVCYHPCEDACNRGQYDNAIAISAMERYISEKGSGSFTPEKVLPDSGARVAIVGAGPAGLTCAYHLARMGHGVTVFDAGEKPGGILRYGIPEYRLPAAVLDRELDHIRSLGVDIQCGRRVGADVPFEEIRAYDAVFVGTGCHRERALFPDRRNVRGVFPSLAFLTSVAKKETTRLAGSTVVIGGGNSAIDAARTALRLGSDVALFYHRSEKEMPAYPEEVQEARKEGVALHFLVQPVDLVQKEGAVQGITLRRTKLGEKDATGRPRPEPVSGSEFFQSADCVISAVGERCDLDVLPADIENNGRKIIVDTFGATTAEKIFAGGDAALAEQNVACAIGSGKRSACAIDACLSGMDMAAVEKQITLGDTDTVSVERYLAVKTGRPLPEVTEDTVAFADINTAYFKRQGRSKREKLPIQKRIEGFEEVCKTLDDASFKKEIARCFHCGVCTGCDNCLKFCPDAAVIKQQDGSGYAIDLDYCKGCGICANECPRSCIVMEEDI